MGVNQYLEQRVDKASLLSLKRGGGICLKEIKENIALELNVELTPNQAVNSSLSIVKVSMTLGGSP